jgi:hypothetical protein
VSERDVTTSEAAKSPCDNDVFDEKTFRSMLDPKFASQVKSERVNYGSDEQGERPRASYRDRKA